METLTKICTRCNVEKTLDNFAYKNKEENKRHPSCKECNRERDRKRYASDLSLRKKIRARSKISNKKTKALTREYILEYKKTHVCADCGISGHMIMDFHHIDPSSKKDAVANLQKNTYNVKHIKAEIDKCVMLCANCHRKRHYREKKAKKNN